MLMKFLDLTYDRLILYYPVSSLVTIFANILQNPQDARARSDLRLMSSVVSFLTMLEEDVHEQNGNVSRMLSVCSEFERIASVVLDKAEREMKGRGKRKQAERERERDRASGALSAELEDGKTLEQLQIETQAAYRRPVQTPSMRPASIASSNNMASPGLPYTDGQQVVDDVVREHNTGQSLGNGITHDVQMQNMQNVQPGDDFRDFRNFTAVSGRPVSDQVMRDMNAVFDQQANLQSYDPELVNSGTGNGFNGLQNTTIAGSSNDNMYQHPFVPQDLWQMPMTLEWDWADMSMGFTPGPFYQPEGFMSEAAQQQALQGDFVLNGGQNADD